MQAAIEKINFIPAKIVQKINLCSLYNISGYKEVLHDLHYNYHKE